MAHPHRLLKRWAGRIGAAWLVTGCTVPINPVGVPADLTYWSLRLNVHAITLGTIAPYDTITLVATPLTVSGTTVPTPSATTYLVSDPTTIAVSATGRVTALQAGQAVTIVASRTIGLLTLSDTATVNVNVVVPPVAVLASFSIHPVAGLDSAVVNCCLQTTTITPFVVDTRQDTLTSVPVYWRIADTTIATTDQNGDVTGAFPGKTTLYAEATVYGVTKHDSITVTVTQPFFEYWSTLSSTPAGSTKAVGYFSPSTQSLVAGGFLIWVNNATVPIDVVFDNPSAADSVPDAYAAIFQFATNLGSPVNPNRAGNIAAFTPSDSTGGYDGVGVRVRYFPTPGSYHFHSSLYNTSGTLVVVSP